MSDPTCALCAKPMRADQAYACGSCGSHLRAALARTAKLAGEARVTIAKLDEVPAGPGKVDDLGWWKTGNALEAIELPYRPEAADAYRAALGELITWARHCCEERGIDYAESGGLDGLCGFLAGQVEWLRHRQEADEAFKAIEDACRQIERIVDRPADRAVVGICPCGWWLYAIAGAETVACTGCGTSYEVKASRQHLLEELEDRLLTPAEIATMASYMGLGKGRLQVRDLVRKWHERGRIVPRAGLGEHTVYRWGEVWPMLIATYGGRAA